MAQEAQASLTLMLSTHFDAICDLLLKMHGNLESISFSNLLVCPPIDHM